MGCFYEINDTLLLTEAQGFPVALLDLERHQKQAVTLKEVEGKIFHFKNKSGARAFQLDPVRVYLAEKNKQGKWLFWGKACILSLNIAKVAGKDTLGASNAFEPEDWCTSGTYKIIEIYDPQYQKIFTEKEAPPA